LITLIFALVHRNVAATRIRSMNARWTKRLVREGEFVAEVEVSLVEAEEGWTPYLSLEDAYELDDVRDALRARSQ
jgi:hypothetical protein